MKKIKWEKMGCNYILDIDNNCYISYLPEELDNDITEDISNFCDSILTMLSGEKYERSEETALVIVDDNGNKKFAILNGDHRPGYEKCKNLKDCLKYYEEHISNKSNYSTYENN